MTDMQPMRALHNWREETSVVPFSGIQFLDFGFEIFNKQFVFTLKII